MATDADADGDANDWVGPGPTRCRHDRYASATGRHRSGVAARTVRRRWKGGSYAEPPLYEPSLDDQWCNETRRRVALKIGDWLIKSGITHRRIDSLQLWELEGVAEMAIAEYTDARCERYTAEEERERQQSSSSTVLPDRLLLGI